MQSERRIVVTAAAGLVGQNLMPRLKAKKLGRIIGIDKHPANSKTLARLHPDVEVIKADLARPGSWEQAFAGLDVLILNHAQIGGVEEKPFIDNNVTATHHVIEAAWRSSNLCTAGVKDVAECVILAIAVGKLVVYAPAKWASVMMLIHHLSKFIVEKIDI